MINLLKFYFEYLYLGANQSLRNITNMKTSLTKSVLAVLILLPNSLLSYSQLKERSEIEDKYKWDMTELYPSEDAWRADLKVIREKVSRVTSFRGKLNESLLLPGITLIFFSIMSLPNPSVRCRITAEPSSIVPFRNT